MEFNRITQSWESNQATWSCELPMLPTVQPCCLRSDSSQTHYQEKCWLKWAWNLLLPFVKDHLYIVLFYFPKSLTYETFLCGGGDCFIRRVCALLLTDHLSAFNAAVVSLIPVWDWAGRSPALSGLTNLWAISEMSVYGLKIIHLCDSVSLLMMPVVHHIWHALNLKVREIIVRVTGARCPTSSATVSHLWNGQS